MVTRSSILIIVIELPKTCCDSKEKSVKCFQMYGRLFFTIRNGYMRILFFCFSLVLLIACSDPPEYPIEPELTFVGLSKTTLKQGLGADSLFLILEFTDGDADVGSKDSVNIFLTDTRTGFVDGKFIIPIINTPGGGDNGISGEITLRLDGTCCIFSNGQAPCTASTEMPTNTLSYDIYMMDRAGNKSNVVNTGPITVLCD